MEDYLRNMAFQITTLRSSLYKLAGLTSARKLQAKQLHERAPFTDLLPPSSINCFQLLQSCYNKTPYNLQTNTARPRSFVPTKHVWTYKLFKHGFTSWGVTIRVNTKIQERLRRHNCSLRYQQAQLWLRFCVWVSVHHKLIYIKNQRDTTWQYVY